jgi:hypothetical protein
MGMLMSNNIRVYNIGEIPDQSAWEDQPLDFKVSLEKLDGAKIDAKWEPQPKGQINYDHSCQWRSKSVQ